MIPSSSLPPELSGDFATCFIALRQGRYLDALNLFDQIITECFGSTVPLDSKDLAISILGVVSALRNSLHSAFGDKWPEEIPPMPEEPIPEINTTCSFCFEVYIDPQKLILGPNSISICADCVRTSYTALFENAGDTENDKEA